MGSLQEELDNTPDTYLDNPKYATKFIARTLDNKRISYDGRVYIDINDHAALCKAVRAWDKAHKALDHTMTEEAFADGVSAVTNAREHMLKLAKEGLDGTK